MEMKKTLQMAALVTVILAPFNAYAKPLIIAVIDTGIDKSIPNLCKHGHKSFTDEGPLVDQNGHGTHIAGIINNYAGSGNYCIVSIKWWDSKNTAQANVDNLSDAIRYAANLKVDYANISGGGNTVYVKEASAIQYALKQKVIIVSAAGNQGFNLDAKCDFYPACWDPRIVTVGNLQPNLKSRNPSSNYGHYVKRWERGTNIKSNLPNGNFGTMTGTSQATAVATGKLVFTRLKK